MKTMMLLLIASFTTLTIWAQQRQVEKAIQDKYYNKYGKDGENKLNDWLGGNLGNVTPGEEYKFPVSITQHITTYEKGKVKSESDIKYYLNEENLSFAMDGSQMGGKSKKKSSTEMITVYDMPQSALLMYNLTDKTLLAMNMNAFRSKASQEAAKQGTPKTPQESDVKCGKSGKTKTILGHSCYEYVCKKEGDDSYTAMWINSDVKIPEIPYMAGGIPGTFGKSKGIAGTVLEIDSYKDGELSSTMLVTEINEKADLALKTADFKTQSMPAVKF